MYSSLWTWLAGDNYLDRSTTTILTGLTHAAGVRLRLGSKVARLYEKKRRSHGARQSHNGPTNDEVQGVTKGFDSGGGCGEDGGQREQRATPEEAWGVALNSESLEAGELGLIRWWRCGTAKSCLCWRVRLG